MCLSEKIHQDCIEIDKEIQSLKTKKSQVYSQYIFVKQEELEKKYVGRYYADSDSTQEIICKIIGVPKVEYRKTGIDFNEWRLPALIINRKYPIMEQIRKDTVYIGDIETHLCEVSQEDFDKMFWEVITEFREEYKIGDIPVE